MSVQVGSEWFGLGRAEMVLCLKMTVLCSKMTDFLCLKMTVVPSSAMPAVAERYLQYARQLREMAYL